MSDRDSRTIQDIVHAHAPSMVNGNPVGCRVCLGTIKWPCDVALMATPVLKARCECGQPLHHWVRCEACKELCHDQTEFADHLCPNAPAPDPNPDMEFLRKANEQLDQQLTAIKQHNHFLATENKRLWDRLEALRNALRSFMSMMDKSTAVSGYQRQQWVMLLETLTLMASTFDAVARDAHHRFYEQVMDAEPEATTEPAKEA